MPADRLNAEAFILAARVPADLHPQRIGEWRIERHGGDDVARSGFSTRTTLSRPRELDPEDPYAAEMNCGRRNVVMEDGWIELSRHLPVWLNARGRVLVTGLGLGCVVRGLLASPCIEHIDVIEMDAGILGVVGAEFASEPRVKLHLGNALEVEIEGAWDFAWHDIDCGTRDGQVLHARLLARFKGRALRQGAWMFPRRFKSEARKVFNYVG